MPTTQARRDPITGQWIIVAVDGSAEVAKPTVERTLEALPDAPPDTETPWAQVTGDAVLDRAVAVDRFRVNDGLFTAASTAGRHERIIEGETPLETLGADRMSAVLSLYRDRLLEFADDNRSRQLGIAKAQGAAAGATMAGSTSEAYALSFVPDEMRRKLTAFAGHYRKAGSCLLCDMVRFERAEEVRVVDESLRHVAFAPWASHQPYELIVAPKGHHPSYLTESDGELTDLAHLFIKTLRRLSVALDAPAYRYTLVTSPQDAGADSGHFHWHFVVRPVVISASALDGLTTYNAVPPKLAAQRLREVEL